MRDESSEGSDVVDCCPHRASIIGQIEHLIGTPYVDSIKPYILALTGLNIVVGPNEAATLDIRSDRIFIQVNADGLIEGFRAT